MSVRVRPFVIEGSRPEPQVWFCAYCGRGGPAGDEPEQLERACWLCGFGLLIETVAEVAPAPTDAFLVVDDGFAVVAISHQAEELLGVDERSVVGHSVTDLLLPVDPGPSSGVGLLAAVAESTSGAAGARPARLRLRTACDPGLSLHARVGRCGPPIGALIVLEPTAAQRSQLRHGA